MLGLYSASLSDPVKGILYSVSLSDPVKEIFHKYLLDLKIKLKFDFERVSFKN